MKYILSIIFILSTFYCYSQTNELVVLNKIILAVNVVPIFEDVNFVVDKGSKRLRNGVNEHTYFLLSTSPPLTWSGCMSSAMKACKTSAVCSFGYALTPAAYMLGWSIGCSIYSAVKPIEDLSKEVINKIK